MAKSKNHTGQHEQKKNHRNGIKKQRKERKATSKGLYRPWKTNSKYAKKGTLKAMKEAAQKQE
ncbi:ribosomal protein L29-like protein [Naegleria gruberi]|uniref:60S ribosomal protein L29 n=1 Tax=Naegleria gruberi TaxID=5762 RepID=D2VCX4_NAEGR|nr:ribosomal protein L29-like protein [Naegleria gruberi]EFC45499.1 ribosomal protein L29-like protein [Naegleria gruberi]|eukprot:XP_002678243.1 ribosomal protein L29-like protein [Naegleria gruberi strain NEG-M]